MTDSSALFAVRLVHTVIWAVIAAAILALPIVAGAQRFGVALGITIAVAVEGIALGASGGSCPLTAVAARYTMDRGPAFDIFLPAFLATWNKVIFGAIFFAGEVFVLVQEVRAGDDAALARQMLAILFGGAVVAFAFLSYTGRHLHELGIRP